VCRVLERRWWRRRVEQHFFHDIVRDLPVGHETILGGARMGGIVLSGRSEAEVGG